MRSLIIALLLVSPLIARATPDDGPTPAVIAPLAAKSLLLDVKALPDGRLVTVGERGHVLVSRDQGASWQQSPSPVRSTLTAVYFADARRGWAVGHDETILRTVDGGASWMLVHYAPQREQPLLSVWFDGAGHGLAVGAYSTMYRSDDGGASWRSVPFVPQPLAQAGAAPRTAAKAAPAKHAGGPEVPTEAIKAEALTEQPHLNSIAADRAGRLYVTAEAGHLYRSDDGGEHWLELPSPYSGSIYGTVSLEGDSLLAYGQRGHLFRSDDAGRSWHQIAVATQALLAGATRLDERTIVIAGLEGAVLVSTDGGHTFRVHQEADRKGFDAAAAVTGGVIVCGEGGARRLTLAELGSGG